MTDLPTFFNAVRASVFGGSLTTGQVQGLDIIVMMLTAAVSAGTAWKVAGNTYQLLRPKKPRGQ